MAFRTALRLKPDAPMTYYNFGTFLGARRRFQESEAAYRAALRLKPDYPEAHTYLGNALREQGRPREAEAAYREALRLRPDFPEAHCNLGHALRNQARFADAVVSLRRGHELGQKVPDWRYPSAAWVQQCERLVEFDRKLSAVLKGESEPANSAERVVMASLCQQFKRLHLTAARFYADAFAADAKLAADLHQQHRYNAACSAALAAAGQAEDARDLPDKVALTLRRQARQWLREDLSAYVKVAGRDDPKVKDVVRQRLTHWRQDSDLASVRDKAALDAMPENERQQWQALWREVEALLRTVQPK